MSYMRIVAVSLLVFCCGTVGWSQPPEGSPRMSPLVKVIQKVESAVIALFVPTDEKYRYASGSGTIIHQDGYVLTNNHVLPRSEGFAVFRERAIRFVVVGRNPEKDVAIIRLRDVTGPLPTVPLGHSYDVMNGESVVVSGNPGGRGIVHTSGIVSSKRALLNAPSALVMTQLKDSRRDAFIQFDAASNHGNSGGPLVNMEGELIGIVSALVPKEQNVGFAIPVDRVRELFERVLDPEVVYERRVGIRLNSQADEALVADVAEESAAASGGLRGGDTLISANGMKLRHAADWIMFLHQHLPTGKPIELVARRGSGELPMKLLPRKSPPLSPVDGDDVQPGLQYEFYHGEFKSMPDFSELPAQKTGVVPDLDMDAIRGDRSESYAVVLDGLIEFKQDGLYRLTITSDDGSRLYLHGEPMIDNDGNHPPMPASRLLRAKAGLHPIRIDYFQGIGGSALELKLEQINEGGTQPIEFFYEKD